MKKNVVIFIAAVSLLFASGCKDIYKPAIISSDNYYLVVEGVLNVGPGPTTINITRSFRLEDSARLQPVTGATVNVEGKDNSVQPLINSGGSAYSSPGLTLGAGTEYRLHIRTSAGKEYFSDYIMVMNTPPIDSLGFVRDEKGVTVHVNTHDPTNTTRYYRWDFDETWEIRTYYNSQYKYENNVVSLRPAAEDISICWKYDKSHQILTGSSASLESDVIYRAPLIKIGNNDEKLDVRYSILLRQYALDKAGYQFFELMRKNTESLGSIFDAQPSEMHGNIHSIDDPDEKVIGYITATNVQEKRYFINRFELGGGWNFYQDCPSEDIANHPDSIADAYAGGKQIYSANLNPFTGRPSRYLVSRNACVDCQARGGSVMRPTYW